MAKYRTRLQIIAEILEIVRDGAKKTHIMYRANLSYKSLCRYLDEIVEAGLVRVDRDEGYVVAAKGVEFLGRFAAYTRRRAQVRDALTAVDAERRFLEQNYVNSDRGVGGSRGLLERVTGV